MPKHRHRTEQQPTASPDMLGNDMMSIAVAGLEPAAVDAFSAPAGRSAMAELLHAHRTQLVAMWCEAFKAPPPLRIGDGFLRRAIAFQLQLDAADPRMKAAHRRVSANSKTGTLVAPKITPKLKGGARLVREWNGRTYQVQVINDGFIFDSRPYGSLSEIAREITGARWSGPAFFGLKKRGGTKHGA